MEIPAVFSYPALAAVLVFLIIAISRGWLIPQRSHEREIEAEKRRADEWKAVAEERGKTISIQGAQINALLEVGDTVDALLRAISPPSMYEKAGE